MESTRRPPLRAGQVVVVAGDPHKFASRVVRWATQSSWTHCIIMVNDSEAVEAWFPVGVRRIDAQERLEQYERQGRNYWVLDLPDLDDEERALVGEGALLQLGRRYDVVQAVIFLVLRRFINDGPLRVVCSRVVTEAYERGLSRSLFSEYGLRNAYRAGQLAKGWALPSDFVNHSDFWLYASWTNEVGYDDFSNRFGPGPVLGRCLDADDDAWESSCDDPEPYLRAQACIDGCDPGDCGCKDAA